MRPPLTLISTECHPRGRTCVSDCPTRARSSCSQRCNSKFTVALRRWKPPRKTGVALCRLSRVCGSAMDNSVAFVLKDCATSRSGRSALQNVTFGCVSVKSRKSKSGDDLALLGPSLMFHAFCARFATHANSDRATHEIRCASGSVCNGSVGNVTYTRHSASTRQSVGRFRTFRGLALQSLQSLLGCGRIHLATHKHGAR